MVKITSVIKLSIFQCAMTPLVSLIAAMFIHRSYKRERRQLDEDIHPHAIETLVKRYLPLLCLEALDSFLQDVIRFKEVWDGLYFPFHVNWFIYTADSAPFGVGSRQQGAERVSKL
ncbi:hypothetical protein QBC37DRAFT_380680 [Rhypophila decipiens]|uniref:Uncharacterized protein n=1 Tax=Rhypophila decipiens TaxID=261697 RepID=A0AAN7B1W7_9PEZI|nr:hypothetical protein QBC37DRAFT_380680 [Rhypophila decipiens]